MPKKQPEIKQAQEFKKPVAQEPINPQVKAYKPDDDELAQELVNEWGERFAFFRSMWHRYDNGYWVAVEELEMLSEIRESLRIARNREVKVNTSRLLSVERMYRVDRFVRQERIGQGDEYLNLQNGLLNLRTLLMEKHRPDLYFTWQLPFEYQPTATAPTFEKFMDTSLVSEVGNADVSLQHLLLEAMGYSLTADTNRKVSFWLYGKKDAGKSTFVALLAELLGDMHVAADLNKLATDDYMLYRLADKRAVTCTESDTGSMLADGVYKMLVGGIDRVVANIKFKDPIEFIPKCKVWWAMNEPPRISDRSGAVFRRIIPIPFLKSVPMEQQDEHLMGKLRAELPGILNLVIDGLKRLRRQGYFTKAKASDDMREAIRLMNDTELTFINEMMAQAPTHEISSSELYRVYRDWCEENGFARKNINQVSREWERLGFHKVRRMTGSVWLGLKQKGEKINLKDL